MAVVKLGGIVAGVTGSVSGSTFHNFNNTQRIINKISRSNKFSPSRYRHQRYIGTISKQWRKLTDAQRKQWLSVTRHNNTGYQLYQELNLLRLLNGSPLFTTLPFPFRVAIVVKPLTLTYIPNNVFRMFVMVQQIFGAQRIAIFIGIGNRKDISHKNINFRFLRVSVQTLNTNHDITDAQISALFGYTVRTGQALFVRFFIFDQNSCERGTDFYISVKRT